MLKSLKKRIKLEPVAAKPRAGISPPTHRLPVFAFAVGVFGSLAVFGAIPAHYDSPTGPWILSCDSCSGFRPAGFVLPAYQGRARS